MSGGSRGSDPAAVEKAIAITTFDAFLAAQQAAVVLPSAQFVGGVADVILVDHVATLTAKPQPVCGGP